MYTKDGNEKKTKIYLFKIKPCSRAAMSSIARLKVLSLAAKDLNVALKSIELKKHANGKPYIYGANNWHFNISHTDGIIGIAISDEPVGIDVERIRDADLRIAKRFFTVSENCYIDSAACKDKRFFEIWTKKEAYLKYTGKGLSVSLKSFDVFKLPYYIHSFEKDGYIISICLNHIRESMISIELM